MLKEQLNELAERISVIRDFIKTEEATKSAMIMPFFQLLGYDVFNPMEFVPEYTADVGIKKNEKVDYAIMIDEKPLILIECKSCNSDLGKHASQLFRYFGTTDAKFGILTNGIIYKFYTDLENTNKMDSIPFLTIDIINLKERDFSEISKFTKTAIDVDGIMQSAENLKYGRLIKDWLEKEMESPSQELVRVILNDIYEGIKNRKIIDKFTPLVKRSIQQFIADSLNDKIKNALSKENAESEAERAAEEDSELSKKNKINTTIEELEAYGIIKAILRKTVESNRIVYRDTESYFGVLLDDNNRKWICRVYLSGKNKHIDTADLNKKQIRHDITSVDDIYSYSEDIIESCKRYLDEN